MSTVWDHSLETIDAAECLQNETYVPAGLKIKKKKKAASKKTTHLPATVMPFTNSSATSLITMVRLRRMMTILARVGPV